MKIKIFADKKGQIIVVGLVIFSIILILSGSLVIYISSQIRLGRQNVARSQALQIAEAGIDQAAYQFNHDLGYTGESNTALGNGSFTTTVTNIDSQHKRVTSTGTVAYQGQNAVRTVKATVAISHTVISFRYGVQAGNGGFSLANSATITGNVFSSGPIIGISDNYIYGDAVSSGATGTLYGVHVTGNVFSHSIGNDHSDTVIDQDAYYASITNATVNGTPHPGSPDQPSAPLPISDEQIEEWESFALAGGVIDTCDADGNYVVENNTSLGPKKIECNLEIKNVTFTITGPLWVTGNITVRTNANLKMDEDLGSENVAIIADKPSDRSGSGIIEVEQGSTFEGSGSPGSFVFLISQNNSAESGGSTAAISQNQGAAAMVAYAGHGLVTMNQSANVKEVTAYKISLSQSANVTYDVGLPSTLFESGPGASWAYEPGSYVIVK